MVRKAAKKKKNNKEALQLQMCYCYWNEKAPKIIGDNNYSQLQNKKNKELSFGTVHVLRPLRDTAEPMKATKTFWVNIQLFSRRRTIHLQDKDTLMCFEDSEKDKDVIILVRCWGPSNILQQEQFKNKKTIKTNSFRRIPCKPHVMVFSFFGEPRNIFTDEYVHSYITYL